MKRLAILVLLFLPFMSEAAHITDRLLAGMYSEPDTSKEPIKLLPSGTPLDILSEKNGLVKIKLVDGKEGWVEKRFLSESKPAKSRLLVLQSKYKQMQREFDGAKRELIALKTAKPVAKNGAASSTSVAGAELALKEAQHEITRLKKQLEISPDVYQKPMSESTLGFSAWWFIVLLIVALPLGFAGGLWLQDARQRKKHGGFRI